MIRLDCETKARADASVAIPSASARADVPNGIRKSSRLRPVREFKKFANTQADFLNKELQRDLKLAVEASLS